MFDYSSLTLVLTGTADPQPTAPSNPASVQNTNTSQQQLHPTTQGSGQTQSSGSPFGMPIFLIIMLVLMYFLMFRGPQKEKKRREALLSALKKGDKVLTVGGMIGTIIELNENEVILRLDDNTNARGRFTRMAVQQVIEPRANGEKTEVPDKAQ
ncbi:MAG: preprotein translocase subunit YajC [Phycisphaeraceae bacterium]|nr:preprotein translocase subunit YajC [Phycisphaeraceae bacterium]